MFSHRKRSKSLHLVLVLAVFVLGWGGGVQPAPAAAPQTPAAQVDIVGPVGSGMFGIGVAVLPNGNFLVADPEYDKDSLVDVGAVYLYDGRTQALISALTGATAGDQVGLGGYVVLKDGSYLIISPYWSLPGAARVGALTHCSATQGCTSVSAANSLIGSTANDQVGYEDVIALDDGGYIAISPNWDNQGMVNAGAVTWCLSVEACNGPVSTSNSLVGMYPNDRVGSHGVSSLPSGAFVVGSLHWNDDRGAVTRCPAQGCSGEVSGNNSLVGTTGRVGDTPGDMVGDGGVVYLAGGGYVVRSQHWVNGGLPNAGAVTWCPEAGCTGKLTPSNSLVGFSAGDGVGGRLFALPNGAYLVASGDWDNSAAGAADAGAVTWCAPAAPGQPGACGGQAVSADNSLVGTHNEDRVGSWPGAVVLEDGNYVVAAPDWDGPVGANSGAVTWCSPNGNCTGPVKESGGLFGTSAGDNVGTQIYILPDGGYVVASPLWDAGGVVDAGAVTYCPPGGCVDMPVKPATSLVGAADSDMVGSGGVVPLTGGAYVVSSLYWGSVGAVTYCPAGGCVDMVVGAANSQVGSHAGDSVDILVERVGTAGYLIARRNWDNGTLNDAGAVSYCAPNCTGPISEATSLVGLHAGDRVGDSVTLLAGGGYVVGSPYWDSPSVVDAGAVTGCGAGGCVGSPAATNSLVGASAGDQVGAAVFSLENGNYVTHTNHWHTSGVNGTLAVTLGAGGSSTTIGSVTADNSVLGSLEGENVDDVTFNPVYDQLIVGRMSANRVSLLRVPHTSAADGAWDSAGTWDFGPLGAYSDVRIAGGRTVSLSRSSQVHDVQLEQGRLVLGPHDLAVSGEVSLVRGHVPGTDNMIVADGGGELRWMLGGPGRFLFLIGDLTGGADFSPAVINVSSANLSSGAYIGLRVVDAPHPYSRDSQALSRYWHLSAPGITNLLYAAEFGYTPGDVTGSEASLVGLYRAWNAGHWQAGPAVMAAQHGFRLLELDAAGDFSAGNGGANWAVFLPLLKK